MANGDVYNVFPCERLVRRMVVAYCIISRFSIYIYLHAEGLFSHNVQGLRVFNQKFQKSSRLPPGINVKVELRFFKSAKISRSLEQLLVQKYFIVVFLSFQQNRLLLNSTRSESCRLFRQWRPVVSSSDIIKSSHKVIEGAMWVDWLGLES